MSTAAIVAGTAAASIGGAAIASSAAGHAADTQANAAMNAAQLQHQDAQSALDFNKQVYGNNLNLASPWIQAGQSGIANLSYLMGLGGTPGAPQNSTASQTQSTGQPAGLPTKTADSMIGGGRGFLPMDTISASPQLLNNQPTTDASGNPAQPAPSVNGVPSVAPVNTNSLINPALGAPGSLFNFQAPTDVTQRNDPGYQFRLNQGMKALQNSAAARGGLLNGGTAKGLEQFAQDYASNEYSNVYNRALGENTNKFNRLAALSGIGQTSAAQLSSAGQGAANNASNTLLTSAGQIGANINNAAAARASGYVGGANAWGNAIGGIGSNISSLAMLNSIMNNGYDPTNNNSGAPGSQSWMLGPCWIAAELYGGWLEARTRLIREWLRKVYRFDPLGSAFYDWYEQNGERVAAEIRADHTMRPRWRQFFDGLLAQARQWAEVSRG